LKRRKVFMVGSLETKVRVGLTAKQAVPVGVKMPVRVHILLADQLNLCVLLREYALRNLERRYLGNEV
jgi:hypothetical protein